MNTVLIVILVLFYLGSMSELVMAGFRSLDRIRLLAGALAVLFTLIAARALLPAYPFATWGWVAGVALYAGAAGLAVMQGWRIQWVQPEASRWSIVGSVIWITVLLLLTGATLWSFF